jgi:uncharacterized Zn-binding protein involved in type VI secretion
MKKLFLVGAWTAVLMPALALAQSAFDGTWKANLSTAQLPTKADEYLLQGGTYHCNTCAPPVVVKADGHDHKVTGHPYYDTLSVKVVDDRTVEFVYKKAGKTVTTSKMLVSVDGKTAAIDGSDSSASNAGAVKYEAQFVRVAAGPSGSNAISGSWRTTKVDSSENGLVWTYKVEGSTLKMTNPLGQSFSAKMDGTDAPYHGDPGTTGVSIKSIDKMTIEETDKRDGKAIGTSRMTVSADGKTAAVAWTDVLHGTSGSFDAVKQ